MNEERTLLTLLVHLRSEEQYYKEHAAFVEAQWAYLNSVGGWACNGEFEQWRERRRLQFEALWFWPPWRYNDVVGYVRVYYDGGQRILAEAYLPKKRISRQLRRKDFYWHGKIGETLMSHVDNNTLRQAVTEAVEEASHRLANRQLHLEYDVGLVGCLDIAKLITIPDRN
jgi:hypothetical protein